MADETSKLQHHLSLLREEYVKLQTRYADLEQKYNIVVATSGDAREDSFVSRVLRTIADLYNKPLYSDVQVQLDGCNVYAHRFVLAARSDSWGVTNLDNVSQLDWSDLNPDVGMAMLKWVYTDQVDFSMGETFILQLMHTANTFKLTELVPKCENALMSHVNCKNCIKFFTTADEIGATALREHCSQLISTHWNDFTTDDFNHMTAPLLYKMFKSKTEYPLHSAIRLQREDVVFLYLVENSSKLPDKLNELDTNGDLPLQLALRSKQSSVAKTLVEQRVNVNAEDRCGFTLLHRAIESDDDFSAIFLLDHGAKVSVQTPGDQETPLHFAAKLKSHQTNNHVKPTMEKVVLKLLEKKADPNAQDRKGFTPLHNAVSMQNEIIVDALLKDSTLSTELKTADGYTALWFALESCDSPNENNSLPVRLINKGASVNAVCPATGDSLLHLCCQYTLEEAALFLCQHKANPNHLNLKGESPLHLTCVNGMSKLTAVLLEQGADPNMQTLPPKASELSENRDTYHQTPVHLAILHKHPQVIQVILDFKGRSLKPNLNLKNSAGVTPLGLALKQGVNDVAAQLIQGGADIGSMNSDGYNLLHESICNGEQQSALFLLQQGADINTPSGDRESPLELSIRYLLSDVVEALCKRGVNTSAPSSSDSVCPLWMALELQCENIASILIRYCADPDFWSEGPEGCSQTLLHRSIDDNKEDAACFLIRSGCDLNSPRRPGADGRGGEESKDLATPIHLCCQWGLVRVAQTLIEHEAHISCKDVEGKTPLHVAIQNQHPVLISLLLSHPKVDLTIRDKRGLTPFAMAMTYKNNWAAQAILDKHPTAAEQLDNRGRNFLHVAIDKADIESVLFLLSVNTNIHSRTQDSNPLSPFHLAIKAESEIIVRNLLLAGANINDLTPQKQTALHMVADNGNSTIASILLENGTDYDAVDSNLNNALHIAIREGHLSVVKVLLTESQINAESLNLKGQNPLHVLANYGKENASLIFELFMDCMPQYPVNKPDVEGNTPLLLAYMKGNGQLSRSLVKHGASLGYMNKHGITIFNYQVPTKQLLYRLLDYLAQEPPWAEGDICLECCNKFGITTRKHHCRHCGRLLCSRCSDKEMPIIKFSLNKPVRVCATCFEVLTLGRALT